MSANDHPLRVKCPYCGANPRGRCCVNPGANRRYLKFREPHVARVLAARKAGKKRGDRG